MAVSKLNRVATLLHKIRYAGHESLSMLNHGLNVVTDSGMAYHLLELFTFPLSLTIHLLSITLDIV